MNLIHRIEHWGDTHHPRWLDIVRIILGTVIFAKGVSFIADTTILFQLLTSSNFHLSIWMAVHYIAFVHIVGGIFIALGFATRIAVVLQLPILIGAVFFVNMTNGFDFLNSEFWLSLAVLLLLLLFLVVGSGAYSLDHAMDRPGYKRWF